jgi:hypothetical protein
MVDDRAQQEKSAKHNAYRFGVWITAEEQKRGQRGGSKNTQDQKSYVRRTPERYRSWILAQNILWRHGRIQPPQN